MELDLGGSLAVCGSYMAILRSCALPTGNLGVAVTSFFTWCYAAGIHLDTGDLGTTVVLRIWRSKAEHEWAHHFFYPFLHSALASQSQALGVIIKQESGTIFSFQASLFEHGTTIAIDGVRPDDTIGLVVVQKRGVFDFTKNSGLREYVNCKGQNQYHGEGVMMDEE